MKKASGKFELLKEITALDFMVIDLHLYLNTHPTDSEALGEHNSLLMQANLLKRDYQMHYGMLSPNDSCSPYPWEWIKEPWPWEYEANFKLGMEERSYVDI